MGFLLYLIAVNFVTFLVFAIDFFLCAKNPELNDSIANSLVLDIFPIAGGAIGMLLALFIFTGLLSEHRMNKHNIAWWFLAIVCLIVWGLLVAVRFGFVSLDSSINEVLAYWDPGKLKILVIYLVAINIITFAAFIWDKHTAVNGNDLRKRAPEARLLGLCLIGGSVGGMTAMYMVHHKTRKWYFVWGLPLFAVLDIAVVVFAHMSGII